MTRSRLAIDAPALWISVMYLPASVSGYSVAIVP